MDAIISSIEKQFRVFDGEGELLFDKIFLDGFIIEQ